MTYMQRSVFVLYAGEIFLKIRQFKGEKFRFEMFVILYYKKQPSPRLGRL